MAGFEVTTEDPPGRASRRSAERGSALSHGQTAYLCYSSGEIEHEPARNKRKRAL